MVIKSKKNCETCGLKDLDNNMYPCCDCLPSNNYEHWEERYEEPKETVNHPNHYSEADSEYIKGTLKDIKRRELNREAMERICKLAQELDRVTDIDVSSEEGDE